jgi:cytidylate kinase
MHDYPVIAIDGPAGSGKSTVAAQVARALGYTLLDTGALYRAVALAAREVGVAWDDAPALARLARALELRFELRGQQNRLLMRDRDISEEIRTPEISRGASAVSALAPVREALLELQRGFARRGALVAEGRDMGTVVFPGAGLKVFLEASARERARRRHRELLARGHRLSYEEVLRQQVDRDRADTQREVAPLRAADDAVVLDTTALSIEQVVQRVLALAGGAEHGP